MYIFELLKIKNKSPKIKAETLNRFLAYDNPLANNTFLVGNISQKCVIIK